MIWGHYVRGLTAAQGEQQWDQALSAFPLPPRALSLAVQGAPRDLHSIWVVFWALRKEARGCRCDGTSAAHLCPRGTLFPNLHVTFSCGHVGIHVSPWCLCGHGLYGCRHGLCGCSSREGHAPGSKPPAPGLQHRQPDPGAVTRGVPSP